MAIQAKTSYHAVDSAQVLTLYAVNFALLLLQGRLYLTTLSTSLLDALNLSLFFFPSFCVSYFSGSHINVQIRLG